MFRALGMTAVSLLCETRKELKMLYVDVLP